MENVQFYDPRTGRTETIDIADSAGAYSEAGFWEKVKTKVKEAGLVLVYKALQLYYVTKNPACPTRVKAGIYAALGYFISPFDFIPDFLPFAGYSDDLSAIVLAVGIAQAYIDDGVRQKAREAIERFFGAGALAELDA